MTTPPTLLLPADFAIASICDLPPEMLQLIGDFAGLHATFALASVCTEWRRQIRWKNPQKRSPDRIATRALLIDCISAGDLQCLNQLLLHCRCYTRCEINALIILYAPVKLLRDYRFHHGEYTYGVLSDNIPTVLECPKYPHRRDKVIYWLASPIASTFIKYSALVKFAIGEDYRNFIPQIINFYPSGREFVTNILYFVAVFNRAGWFDSYLAARKRRLKPSQVAYMAQKCQETIDGGRSITAVLHNHGYGRPES